MSSPDPTPGPNPGDGTEPKIAEPVWTFRGYQMRPSEFNTAMVHLYRGEIQRSNTWRTRLDTTTNWAILSSGAAISFALSDPSHHHGVILLNIGLIVIFLFIEARRDRYYELWSYRVRLLETDFFAGMLVPPFHPSPDWAETLADSLLRPKFPVSLAESMGRRFRRNYLAIFAALILSWLLKTYTQPTPATTLSEFIRNASIGPIGGEWSLGAMILFSVIMLLFGFATLNLQHATGEVLTQHRVFAGLRFGRGSQSRTPPPPIPAQGRAWQRPSSRREEYMTMIISEKAQAIAEKVMRDLNRGVTALHGEGMYTQKPREVLMCAVTETEIASLKNAVKSIDPNGFVIVLPASEIAGRGFEPLDS
jgi:uncharacterized membrane protein